MTVNSILAGIVEATNRNLSARKRARPLSALEASSSSLPQRRDMKNALRSDGVRLIAEIKRASPSKGLLAPHLDITATARSYAIGGAAAISVLTEGNFFKGSFDDLAVVRRAVDLPLLCKDFIIDEYQVYQAALYGADAILLIAAILEPDKLKSLGETAGRLGMAALVEVHSQAEVRIALSAGAGLIGINNRNLADFSVSLETTERLISVIPEHIIVVSESGIRSVRDVTRLARAGVKAILVGEALVTSPDPAKLIRELMPSAGSPALQPRASKRSKTPLLRQDKAK
jgi:indole-3-glycerol phosphate synthase